MNNQTNRLPISSLTRMAKLWVCLWPFFAIGFSISFAACGLIMATTTPVFRCSASIRLEDIRNELSGLQGPSSSKSLAMRMATEVIAIRSKSLIRRSLGLLEWQVSFSRDEQQPFNDCYPEKPFRISIIRQEKTFYRGDVRISFKPGEKIHVDYTHGVVHRTVITKATQPVALPGVLFQVGLPASVSGKNKSYLIRFNDAREVTERILSGLRVEEPAKSSSVLFITISDRNPDFAANAVNALVKQYTQDDMHNRLSFFRNVIRAADHQLTLLNAEVQRSVLRIKAFRKRHALDDPLRTVTDNDPDGKLQLLTNELQVRQQLFSMILERKLSASAAIEASQPNVILVDAAQRPTAAIYPRKGPMLRSAILGGIVLGIAITLFSTNSVSLQLISR